MTPAPEQRKSLQLTARDVFNSLPRPHRRAVLAEMKRQEKRGEQPHVAKAMLKLRFITSYQD